ncbi:hypothetical protein OE903_19925 [Bacillus sp. B6(2022)]|nr:hypothetical protein [Bacillus sp. B6(2022)]
MLGKVSECGFLYEWTGPQKKETRQVELTWQGELSKGQRERPID